MDQDDDDVGQGPREPEERGVGEHALSSSDEEEEEEEGPGQPEIVVVEENPQRPPPLMGQRVDARLEFRNFLRNLLSY